MPLPKFILYADDIPFSSTVNQGIVESNCGLCSIADLVQGNCDSLLVTWATLQTIFSHSHAQLKVPLISKAMVYGDKQECPLGVVVLPSRLHIPVLDTSQLPLQQLNPLALSEHHRV